MRAPGFPALLACCAGLVFVLSGWPVPVLLSRTTAAIGRMALPLALPAVFEPYHDRIAARPAYQAAVMANTPEGPRAP